MRRDRFNAPLTDAEREFAAAHHYLMENWSLISREEFQGSSHEKITMEVYRK